MKPTMETSNPRETYNTPVWLVTCTHIEHGAHLWDWFESWKDAHGHLMAQLKAEYAPYAAVAIDKVARMTGGDVSNIQIGYWLWSLRDITNSPKDLFDYDLNINA